MNTLSFISTPWYSSLQYRTSLLQTQPLANPQEKRRAMPISRQFKLGLMAALVSLLALAIDAGSVQAKVVTKELKDANRNTGWQIEYDDQQVYDVSFKGKIGKIGVENQGTLMLTKVWPGNPKPIAIAFQHVAQGDDSELRITLNETVINATRNNWDGFHDAAYRF